MAATEALVHGDREYLVILGEAEIVVAAFALHIFCFKDTAALGFFFKRAPSQPQPLTTSLIFAASSSVTLSSANAAVQHMLRASAVKTENRIVGLKERASTAWADSARSVLTGC